MNDRVIVDKVGRARWEQAQQWERQHWVRTQKLRARYFKNYIWRTLALLGMVSKHRGDDWNHWWKKQFDDYQFLPPAIQNALEVGCGPYTNIRLIRERCSIEHLYLSDPLIRTYVRFKLTLVADLYRKGECVLDDHPLEELPFASDYFDLVVMINVLDHVQDAQLCMENLLRVVKRGGIVILGQDLTNEEDLLAMRDDIGATGHPIKLDHNWFTPYLDGRFSPIINKVLSREQGRSPEYHYGNLIFAGRRV